MPITYQQTYQGLPINTNKEKQQGCDTTILDRLYDQTQYMINKYAKVLQVRFDIRYPQDNSIEPRNDDFTRFNRNFKRNLERNYPLPKENKIRAEKINFKDNPIQHKNTVDPMITLVIEKHHNNTQKSDTEKEHPHAHVLVHVNGNEKKSGYDIQQRAVREWNTVLDVNGNNGLVDFCNRQGPSSYMIDRNNPEYEAVKNQAFHQASYLAKTRGKEEHNKGQWRIMGSRIPKT
jgi:hypothetical protein